MLGIKLDVQGHLLYLRAVPPQVDPGSPKPGEPDWNLLFAEAGLDKASNSRLPVQSGFLPILSTVSARLGRPLDRNSPIYFCTLPQQPTVGLRSTSR